MTDIIRSEARLIVLITRRIVKVAEKRDARPGRNSQLKTFAGILQTTLTAIVWGFTVLQVLEVVGINLTPLLAGASVVAAAVALAAQTIVKDMLNGMLILMEDQFNVGDVVRLTGMTGTVEAMTLRLTQVREAGGATSLVDVRQAEQLVSIALLEIVSLKRDIAQQEHLISLLLGGHPGPVVRGRPLDEQPQPGDVPAGLPSTLLERRPAACGSTFRPSSRGTYCRRWCRASWRCIPASGWRSSPKTISAVSNF